MDKMKHLTIYKKIYIKTAVGQRPTLLFKKFCTITEKNSPLDVQEMLKKCDTSYSYVIIDEHRNHIKTFNGFDRYSTYDFIINYFIGRSEKS